MAQSVLTMDLFGGTYSVDLSRISQAVNTPNRLSGSTLQVFYDNLSKPEYNINFSTADEGKSICKKIIGKWDTYKQDERDNNATFIAEETTRLQAEIEKMRELMDEFKATLGLTA